MAVELGRGSEVSKIVVLSVAALLSIAAILVGPDRTHHTAAQEPIYELNEAEVEPVGEVDPMDLPEAAPPAEAVDGRLGITRTPGPAAAPTIEDIGSSGVQPSSIGYLSASFPGLRGNQLPLEPPDPQLAAGPGHLVEMVNIHFVVYTKAGGIVSSGSLRSFFLVPNDHVKEADPKVMYDAQSGRFFATYFSTNDNGATPVGRLYLAVSTTNDPTNPWLIYHLDLTHMPDYPGLGLSNDKVVISYNGFTIPRATATFVGARTIVFQKSDLLAGVTVSTSSTPLDTGLFTLRPAQNLSSGNDVFMAEAAATTSARLWRITGTPDLGNVAFTFATLAISPQTSPPDSQQLGGAPFDGGDFRMLDTAWRDGRLWAAAATACDWGEGGILRACLHLIEFDTNSASVVQDIVFGAPGQYFSYPAIRPDSTNSIHVVFTRSSTSMYPEARVTGRLGTDPLGTMFGSVLLKTGEVAYDGGRWGDYLGVAIDPSDPTMAWYVGQYSTDNASPYANWGTWIGSGSHVAPQVVGLLRVTTTPAARSTIIVDGIPRDQWGISWMKLPPGEYTVSFSDVPEYITPPDQIVTVVAGETTVVDGAFVKMGQLRVVTSPAVPSTVYVDGHPRNDWGMWMWVPAGTYQVCYGDVAGFVTPACESVVVVSDQLTTATGTFVAQ